MIKYEVNCDSLEIKDEPKEKSKCVGYYNKGESILSGSVPFLGEDGKLWIQYYARITLIPRYLPYDKVKKIIYISYKVICEKLEIRSKPNEKSPCLACYYKGEEIKSGREPEEGEDGKLWVKYNAAKTMKLRYVRYLDNNGQRCLMKMPKNFDSGD